MKKEKKSQKPNLTYYNLLIVQDLWRAHYQILLIVSLKFFIKLNVNAHRTIKKCWMLQRLRVLSWIYKLLRKYKCLCCNKNYHKKFDENLKKQLFHIYKFSKNDINKFILLLQKGVYPYECIDDWEKFSETSFPEKEDFYSHLNNGKYNWYRLRARKKSF